MAEIGLTRDQLDSPVVEVFTATGVTRSGRTPGPIDRKFFVGLRLADGTTRYECGGPPGGGGCGLSFSSTGAVRYHRRKYTPPAALQLPLDEPPAAKAAPDPDEARRAELSALVKPPRRGRPPKAPDPEAALDLAGDMIAGLGEKLAASRAKAREELKKETYRADRAERTADQLRKALVRISEIVSKVLEESTDGPSDR